MYELWEVAEQLKLGSVVLINIVLDDLVQLRYRNGKVRTENGIWASELNRHIAMGTHLGQGGKNGPAIRRIVA